MFQSKDLTVTLNCTDYSFILKFCFKHDSEMYFAIWPKIFDQKSNVVVSEAAVCRCSSKYVFSKISQDSQENTCVGVSF